MDSRIITEAQLKEICEKRGIKPLGKDETATFQLLSVRYDPKLKRVRVPNSVKVLPIDRVSLPEVGEVDVYFVDRVLPTAPDSTKESQINLGTLAFTKMRQGQIVCNGKNPRERYMYLFLRINNLCQNNMKDEHWIAPDGGCTYKLLDNKATAKDKLKNSRLVAEATLMLDTLDRRHLLFIADGFLVPYEKTWSDEEVKAYIVEHVLPTKSDLVLKMDKDQATAMYALARYAEREQLIELDRGVNQWVFTDTKERICLVSDMNKPYDSIKDFFVSPQGKDTVSLLRKALDLNANTGVPKAQSKGKVPLNT